MGTAVGTAVPLSPLLVVLADDAAVAEQMAFEVFRQVSSAGA